MANVLGKWKTSTGPWLAAAVIVVVAFMYWLYSATSSIGPGLSAADSLGAQLPRIADTTFVINPELYSGRRVLLGPVTVSDSLGRAVLATDLPGMAGYPLILDRPVLESAIPVGVGDDVLVAGSVYALTDSLLDVYMQRGFFDAANRERLVGKTTFFLVDSLDYYIAQQEASTDGDGT
jgi:hypothetical protein